MSEKCDRRGATSAATYLTSFHSATSSKTTPYYSSGPNGPGGESFLRDDTGRVARDTHGRVVMAYHGWGSVIGPAPRYLWVTPLTFDSTGKPIRPDKCWPALTC